MSQPLPGQSLDRFAGSVADCLDAFTVALFVVEAKSRRLRLRAFHSLSDSIIPGAVIGEGKGFISWVMKNQRLLHVPYFRRDSRTLGFYSADKGLKSFMAVPLPGRMGVLSADSRSRYAFSSKHERILEAQAVVACELLEAEKAAGLLDFYSSVLKWQMTEFDNCREALSGLLDLLGLDTAAVVHHLPGKQFLVVEELINRGDHHLLEGGIACSSLPGHEESVCRGPQDGCDCFNSILRDVKIGLNEGIAGWVVKHRTGILLERRHESERQGSLLCRDEPFRFGPVILGVFIPCRDQDIRADYGFVFSGDADMALWPSNITEIIEFLLKDVVPWH